MHRDNINLLITQRQELINELIALTKDRFYRVMFDIYMRAKGKKSPREYIVRDFQLQLKEITTWDASAIKAVSSAFKKTPVVQSEREKSVDGDEEYHQQVAVTGRDEQQQCIEMVLHNIHVLNQKLFPSEVKMLKSSDSSLDLIDNFILVASLNIAREIWKKAFFMYEIVDHNNYSQYYEHVENIIVNSIKTTIRRQSNIEAICASVSASEHNNGLRAHEEVADNDHDHDHEHVERLKSPFEDISTCPQHFEEYSSKDSEASKDDSIATEQALRQFLIANHKKSRDQGMSRSSSRHLSEIYENEDKHKHSSKSAPPNRSYSRKSVSVKSSFGPSSSGSRPSHSSSDYNSDSDSSGVSDSSSTSSRTDSTQSSSSSSSSGTRIIKNNKKDKNSKEKKAFMKLPADRLKYEKYHDPRMTITLMNQSKLKKLRNKFM
jgi:hypothetical protein